MFLKILHETTLRPSWLKCVLSNILYGNQNVTFFYKKFQEKYHCQPGEYRG